jgi:hypothetical protein
MTFPREYYKYRPTKGIAPDVPNWEASEEYYSGANNVLFRDGFASRELGHAEVYATPLAAPRYLVSNAAGVRNFWVYAGDSTVSVAEGATHSNISYAAQSSVSVDNPWTGGLLNGLVFLNNAFTDSPVGWDNNPANAMTELPGWPAAAVAGAVRAHRFYLFAMDIQDGSGDFRNRVLWSDSADPGTFPQSWTPAIDNDAGFVDLAEGDAPVIDGGTLRDQFMIYKSRSTWVANFVGGNDVFSFRELFSDVGILNRNCWVEFETNHVLLSDSDVMITDGHSVRSIADKRVRDFITQNTDADNIANSFLAHNLEKNEIWVCFPLVNDTECTLVAVWDYREDTWGFRDVPRILHASSGIISDTTPDNRWDAAIGTWDTNLQIWNTQGFSFRSDGLVMAAYGESKLQLVDGSTSFDGAPVTATLIYEGKDMGIPERLKLINRVVPKFDAPVGTGINIRVGAANTVDGPYNYTPNKLFVVGSTRDLTFGQQGRYLSFEFSSTGVDPWKLTGFDVEYRATGYY